jgi:CRISPR/Cas system Type II protein with McrA/HNH and RuvC-like nuclease domain
VREDHKFRIDTREMIFKEQEGICVYCKKPIIGKPTLDHIIPIQDHEAYSEDNYVVCCIKCNKNKGNYIVFTNLFDKEIYPVITVPYFAKWDYIQTNKFKEK